MNKLQFFCCQLLLLLLPVIGKASAYWIEIKGSGKVNQPLTIQVIYGHIDAYSIRHRDTGKELTLAGDFKITVRDAKGQITTIALNQKADCWEGTFTPAADGVYRVLGINDTHPVIDRAKTGGKNVRPIDYLCADYRVGEAAISYLTPVQLLDIVTQNTNGVVTVMAFNKGGHVVANTKLRVFNPENWEKELVLDDKGSAVFKTTMPGLYIIRQDWDDPSPGNYKGLPYLSVRHRCNYSLLVQQ